MQRLHPLTYGLTHTTTPVSDIPSYQAVIMCVNMSKRRIFSAIQPTGIPHLGNYFGALQNWVQLQNDPDNKLIFSIVDLHSITLPQEPDVLRQSIRDCVAVLLACGIDPERSILFQQSSVHQHAELAWVLGCKTTLARLGQFPQWKSKSGGDKKKECVGLYTYPVLQSADILLYKTTHVPVGEDQYPHLELAQDLARIFNNNFGSFFSIPEAIAGEISKVKSLRNPSVKMSKSEPDRRGRIELTDSYEEIQEKFRKAVTDFTGAVTFDPDNRPGVSNLVAIHAAVQESSLEEICEQNMGVETGEYKLILAEAVNAKLAPIREKIFELRRNPEYIDSILRKGAERASEVADKTFSEVKKRVGFV
ncbi:tryptophan--tRNA ligase, mitochondrial-like isoform X2 [Acanthaster planci]|uniref:Tryptophan--tRNA ligase, mitochondrial n=1 Tax=Acanthaster planci TaxID=133434 RepID=A0A8B7YDY4_ACAPL|nr:tryptophan--tRNA ligase, mitochondrial-like isoform X2 [Acanthaster planci]